MAEIKQESFDQIITATPVDDQHQQIKQARHTISRARSESSEEREQRLKMLRDKQNEERQRKLEELKAQALAAQQFREMKEQERRKRLEELRLKESDRRQQVGERKRLIYEAERDRRESILKKNQEREIRYEMKRRNDRGSLAFAFGSSTPRMLEPADTGGSFWGYRRATSTSNIMFSALPLTRRSSERELDGSKKRATSAGGLDRNNLEGADDGIIPAGCASGYMGRRRTDLMPTIPNRDSSAVLSKRPFTKSPGRTYSLTRLDQLSKPRKARVGSDLPSVSEQPITSKSLSTSPSSMSRSMSHLAVAGALNKSNSRSLHALSIAPVLPIRTNRAVQLRNRPKQTAPTETSSGTTSQGSSRPGSALSQQSTSSLASTVNMRVKSAGPRKPRPITMAGTGITHDSNKNNVLPVSKNDAPKPPIPKPRNHDRGRKLSQTDQASDKAKKSTQAEAPSEKPEKPKRPTQAPPEPIRKPSQSEQGPSDKPDKPEKPEKPEKPKKLEAPKKPARASKPASAIQSPSIEAKPVITQEAPIETPKDEPVEPIKNKEDKPDTPKKEIVPEEKPLPVEVKEEKTPIPIKENKEEKPTPKVEVTESEPVESSGEKQEENVESVDMTASMIAKIRITTEEEAKAALAERRRLAREEAERQALAEKLRQEQEEERQRQEEEQLRKLAEEQRKAEEERLAQAIKEAQKREEEERLRQQEELKLKLEREEQEKKLREENEKKKAEMEERLRIEEAEREARRKRVEAIMLRTRAKGSPGGQTKNDAENEKNDSELENNKDVVNNKPILDMNDKNNSQEDSLLNGTVKNNWQIISQENGGSHKESQSNGHKNGADNEDILRRDNQTLIEHNVTNNLLAFDPYRNASLDMSANKITMEDNVNSNNPTDSQGTTDLLL